MLLPQVVAYFVVRFPCGTNHASLGRGQPCHDARALFCCGRIAKRRVNDVPVDRRRHTAAAVKAPLCASSSSSSSTT